MPTDPSRRPDLLPDGKAAIVSNPLSGVGVLSFDTGEFRLLVANTGGGRYVAGHLLYARPGVLIAAPFDPERREITGPEVVVIDKVRTEAEGVSPHPRAVFSSEGTLVYAPGGPADATTPVWVDRRGTVQSTGMPPRSYRSMTLSPDGRLLAIIIADPTNDLWVQDLERGTLTRRAFGAEPGRLHWTPDGERLVFGSRRDGQQKAFWIPREGNAAALPFLSADGQPAVGSLSPDGQFVATFKACSGHGDGSLGAAASQGRHRAAVSPQPIRRSWAGIFASRPLDRVRLEQQLKRMAEHTAAPAR